MPRRLNAAHALGPGAFARGTRVHSYKVKARELTLGPRQELSVEEYHERGVAA
jgi:hypothetical protein